VVHISDVRIMGVSEKWIRKVAQANPSRYQLFIVRKIDCPLESGETGAPSLQEGDIILTLNGQLITQISEFDIIYDQEDRAGRGGDAVADPDGADGGPRDVAGADVLRGGASEAVTRGETADQQAPFEGIRERPESRLAGVPIRTGADQLHHGGQRGEDARP
jgi:hypothetical protein